MRAEARPYLSHKYKPRPKNGIRPVAKRAAFVYDSSRVPVFRNGAQIHKR